METKKNWEHRKASRRACSSVFVKPHKTKHKKVISCVCVSSFKKLVKHCLMSLVNVLTISLAFHSQVVCAVCRSTSSVWQIRISSLPQCLKAKILPTLTTLLFSRDSFIALVQPQTGHLWKCFLSHQQPMLTCIWARIARQKTRFQSASLKIEINILYNVLNIAQRFEIMIHFSQNVLKHRH